MDWTVIVSSLITGISACIGAFAAIQASNSLMNHRVEQLEKSIDELKDLIRQYNDKVVELDADTKLLEHRIDAIEQELKRIKNTLGLV